MHVLRVYCARARGARKEGRKGVAACLHCDRSDAPRKGSTEATDVIGAGNRWLFVRFEPQTRAD